MRFTRVLTMMLIGGAIFAALPDAAQAGRQSDRISDRLYHIEERVDRLPGVYNPYERLTQIDRLQHRLKRLEYRSDELRGRQARQNDYWIDTLQSRLYKIEKRTKYRLAKRHRHGHHHRGRPHRTYQEPNVVVVPRQHGHGGVVISGTIGFPIGHHY